MANALVASWSVPVTCTSSGAGEPKFRIWLVMSGGG